MAESPDNARVAETLDRVAELLELQGGNPHRARSYRRAAETVRGADREMAEVLKEKGVEGLKAFGGVTTPRRRRRSRPSRREAPGAGLG
jgi:DNA polymerase (family 10)